MNLLSLLFNLIIHGRLCIFAESYTSPYLLNAFNAIISHTPVSVIPSQFHLLSSLCHRVPVKDATVTLSLFPHSKFYHIIVFYHPTLRGSHSLY